MRRFSMCSPDFRQEVARLHRDCTATKPNPRWVADITSIPTCERPMSLSLASTTSTAARSFAGTCAIGSPEEVPQSRRVNNLPGAGGWATDR